MDASHTDAYLRRIATPRPAAPTAQALRTLHLAHQRTFTRSLVCSLVTDEGRLTLSGRTLKTTAGGERRSTELASDREVLDTYRDSFGIELDRVPPEPAA
ncbi:arylamine N-acetyltransferase [Streptomyces sp. NPDC055400]